MQIWLGKQYLNQAEKQQLDTDNLNAFFKVFKDFEGNVDE